jgi:hypothetical protein
MGKKCYKTDVEIKRGLRKHRDMARAESVVTDGRPKDGDIFLHSLRRPVSLNDLPTNGDAETKPGSKAARE